MVNINTIRRVALAGTTAVSLSLAAAPAKAQLTVFDPSNYSQSILTAARALAR